MPRALVSGAGIAGDAVALFLGRNGWDVVVVEIAPELRSGGQTIDLRGDSANVLADLGLLETCLESTVDQAGAAWVNTFGRHVAEMPVAAFGGNGFISTHELLRTDLSRILHAAAAQHVEHRFGDTIDTITDDGGGVRVTFRKHSPERFDVVIGADGAHSRVRTLTFGPDSQYVHPLGFAHAWFTLTETSNTPPTGGWFQTFNAPGGLVLTARPGHPGQQEIGMTFPATTLPSRRDPAARRALLERTFAGLGWRAGEFLSAARTAPDFALDTYDQIQMPAWHHGRSVLLGDAAWCATPLAGLGTALALVGARTLAQHLGPAASHDLDVRLDAYETAMRLRVASAQRTARIRVRSYAPKRQFGIALSHLLTTIAQKPPFAEYVTRILANYGTEPPATAPQT